MQHKYCAEDKEIILRPMEERDIERLRVWRNDENLTTYLSKIPYITPEKQLEWYRTYQKNPNTLFFAVVDKGKNLVIGTVALYSFNGKSCEVGRILIGDSTSHGKGIGYKSLILAMSVAIDKLGITDFILNVHENNLAARKIYDRAGFLEYGKHDFPKGGIELEMKINSEQFYAKNPEAKTIKVYLED